MSDNLGSAAALGYLAGSYSGAQTGEAVLALMSGLRRRAQPTVDVNAVLQALQEQQQHIHNQDVLIDELQAKIAEWKAYAAEVEARRARQEDYAIWAEAELKKYTGQKK